MLMKTVVLVIGMAVTIAHYLPVAALSNEIARRARIDAELAAQVATLPEVESSVRLLELYR